MLVGVGVAYSSESVTFRWIADVTGQCAFHIPTR